MLIQTHKSSLVSFHLLTLLLTERTQRTIKALLTNAPLYFQMEDVTRNLTGRDFPLFVYRGCVFNPEKMFMGLFQGELLLLVRTFI